MGYRIYDDIYQKIEKRVDEGEFVRGFNYSFNRGCGESDINRIPYSRRTPEVCASLMAYSRCYLSDVPESSRTREFYLNAYFHNDVYEYIKNNANLFDRQFYKDLIATNSAATWSDRNCFKFMPLEYIDEEMCSLAILESTDYIGGNWFEEVARRKPEVLTNDLWNLGARIYSSARSGINDFLEITPEEYKTQEYYKSMCMSNFNVGTPLYTNKGRIMDTIPKNIITEEFLIDLLTEDIENIGMFNEQALETLVTVNEGEKEVLWKAILKIDGKVIKYIPLNDERVEYFLSLYEKDSMEYRWCFKDEYKRYLKKKRNDISNSEVRTQIDNIDTANRVLMGALLYNLEGEDPSKAIDDEINRGKSMTEDFLPIKYRGIIPDALRKDYDSEEYLAMMYDSLDIKIIEEYDNYFYKVELPEKWKVETNGYWSKVLDQEGNKIIEYFYDPKFYDKDAYVKELFVPSIPNEVLKKVLKQDNN